MNKNDLPIQRVLRVGKVTVGLVGLDVAMSRVLARGDQAEDLVVDELMQAIGQQNYIPESAIVSYREALRQEYHRLRQGRENTAPHLSIKILGPGCVSCNRLNTLLFDIMQSLGIAADIEQIHDLDEIWRQEVTRTPALIINGAIKSSGKLPTPAEIEEWLQAALQT